MAVEEAQGHSGGIWILASQSSWFSFNVVDSMHQCVSIRISVGNHAWVGTTVFASLTYFTRCN